MLAEPGDSAPAPLAIGLALLQVFRVLSQRSPLVVAADDLRWIDPASAAALQVAFRRLRDERVGLLATMRDSPEETSVIEQSFEDVRLNHLTVGPLDAKALHTVLTQRVGIDLPHTEIVRVRDATAGNPFFALELGRELARSGTFDPRQPLPVPGSLARLLQVRLDRLSPATTEVLLIVALAGRPTVDVVVAVQGDRASSCSRHSTTPSAKASSNREAATWHCRIRCSPRCSKNARRPMSGGPHTSLLQTPPPTSRNEPATAPTALSNVMRRWRMSLKRGENTPRREERHRQEPISSSSPPI